MNVTGRSPTHLTGNLKKPPRVPTRSVGLGLSLMLSVASCASGSSDAAGGGGRAGGTGVAGGGAGAAGAGGTGGQPSPGGTGGGASGGQGPGGTGGSSSGRGGSSGSAGSAGGGTGKLISPVAMNDVSILFPLGNASDYSAGHLRADALGSRGALLPSWIFQKLPIAGSSPAGIGAPGTAPYANMRVVGLRLDPCFGELVPSPTSTTCRNHLRLVFQELQASGEDVSAFDSGVHAIYSITREDLLAMVNEILRLRQAAGGQGGKGPLAPHALMVSQGLSGSFSTALQKLILQYAGEQNLVRATAMSSENAGFQWAFFGFDVTGAPATASPITIATLPATGAANATREIFFRGFQTSTDPIGSFTPKPTDPDDFTVLADVQLARVDNPTIYTPETVDCARCHTATPLGQNVARDRLHLSETADAEAFQPDGRWVTADEMKTTDFSFASATNPNRPAVNVHSFSYADGLPAINQRTVNETAAVVRFLNDAFLAAK